MIYEILQWVLSVLSLVMQSSVTKDSCKTLVFHGIKPVELGFEKWNKCFRTQVFGNQLSLLHSLLTRGKMSVYTASTPEEKILSRTCFSDK